MSDILRKITDIELKLLANLLAANKPKALEAYSFLQNQITWKQKVRENQKSNPIKRYSESLLFTFYTHRECDLLKNGTFVGLTGDKGYCAFYFTLQKDQSELRECIFKTKRIKYELAPSFGSLNPETVGILHDLAEQRNLKIIDEYLVRVYKLPTTVAAKLEVTIPDDVEVHPLKTHDITLVNDLWPHKYEGSEEYLENTRELSGGLGLYAKSDGKLLAFGLKNEFRGIGNLYTIDSARRKGYGKIIINMLCRKIAEEETDDILAFTVDTNMKPKQILADAGFIANGSVTWLQISKK